MSWQRLALEASGIPAAGLASAQRRRPGIPRIAVELGGRFPFPSARPPLGAQHFASQLGPWRHCPALGLGARPGGGSLWNWEGVVRFCDCVRLSMWARGCVYLGEWGASVNLCVYKPVCECTLVCINVSGSACESVFTCECV